MKNIDKSDFYVIAREPGAENPAIPTWANNSSNPLNLESSHPDKIEYIQIDNLPGAFQLTNVLNKKECDRIVELTEHLGYLEDAAVSLPRSVRHNHSATWVVDDETSNRIWQRCAPFMNNQPELFSHKTALGLNNRFRFYRYQEGDYFSPHTDGAWPGSKAIDGKLIHNAFADRWSQLTLLLFLSDDYEGGNTQFYLTGQDRPPHQSSQSNIINVRTPGGGVLCFPHGSHPFHCLHGSEKIVTGEKFIMRSDVLFEL